MYFQYFASKTHINCVQTHIIKYSYYLLMPQNYKPTFKHLYYAHLARESMKSKEQKIQNYTNTNDKENYQISSPINKSNYNDQTKNQK